MKKVLVIVGTRPEVIKMAPVLEGLNEQDNLQPVLCLTGQHVSMVEQMTEVFNIEAQYTLLSGTEGENRTLSDLFAFLMSRLPEIMQQERPDLVLVHGDTLTALAGALVAFQQRIPIGHVEAGLRTSRKDYPYPEEMNRRLISEMADIHFAPTTGAMNNLFSETVDGKVYLVGNTIVDSCKKILSREVPPAVNEIYRWAAGKKLIVVTCHRRESWGEFVDNLCNTILDIVKSEPDTVVVWPVHGNPIVADPTRRILGSSDKIRLTNSLPYDEFIQVLNRADLILTDSGGVLEEAVTLGIPTLVLRSETERPEAFNQGIVKLVGQDLTMLEFLVKQWLKKTPKRGQSNVFGKGTAGKRIAEISSSYLHAAKKSDLEEYNDDGTSQ